MRRTFALALALAACAASETVPEETRVIGTVELGSSELELVAIRSGMNVAAGQGQGRGGMLDPAHEWRMLRVHLVVRDAGVDREASSYEEFVAQRLLAEELWDSAQRLDAVEASARAWREATLETCDWGGGVALRARLGETLTAWAIARDKAPEAVDLLDKLEVDDCAGLQTALAP